MASLKLPPNGKALPKHPTAGLRELWELMVLLGEKNNVFYWLSCFTLFIYLFLENGSEMETHPQGLEASVISPFLYLRWRKSFSIFSGLAWEYFLWALGCFSWLFFPSWICWGMKFCRAQLQVMLKALGSWSVSVSWNNFGKSNSWISLLCY